MKEIEGLAGVRALDSAGLIAYMKDIINSLSFHGVDAVPYDWRLVLLITLFFFFSFFF